MRLRLSSRPTARALNALATSKSSKAGACRSSSARSAKSSGPRGLTCVASSGRVARLAARSPATAAMLCWLFRLLLEELSSSTGLTVLAVADVHGADDATLDLLRFLGRRLRGTRTLLIATYRDDGLAPDHPLRVAIGELSSHQSTRRVSLPPLSRDAVDTLARGSGIEPAEIYRLTGGNPFSDQCRRRWRGVAQAGTPGGDSRTGGRPGWTRLCEPARRACRRIPTRRGRTVLRRGDCLLRGARHRHVRDLHPR